MRLLLLTLPMLFPAASARGLDVAASIPAPGLYAVSFERLQEAVVFPPVPVAGMRVSQGESNSPSWIEEAAPADGMFGPGERLIVLARSDRDRFAGFQALVPPIRIRSGDSLPSEAPAPIESLKPVGARSDSKPGFEVRRRLEQDRIRVGIQGNAFGETDCFFWARLSSLDPAPLVLTLSEFDETGSNLVDWSQASIELSVTGATWIAGNAEVTPEHSLAIEAGPAPLTAHKWSGTAEERLRHAGLSLDRAPESIELQVPARFTEADDFIADVVYLNWLEIRGPLVSELPEMDAPVELVSTGGDRLNVSRGGLRLFSKGGAAWRLEGEGEYEISSEEGEVFALCPRGSEHEIQGIRPWRRPDLQFIDEGETDYLIIAPERFADGLIEFTEAHRTRGLETEILIAEDAYDSFGSGIAEPSALRSAIRSWHTERKRRGERPGFVLLAGDAGPGRPGEGRNVIPCYTFSLRGSLCATDNPFGCPGEDDLPQVAIGRLPVASREELDRSIPKFAAALRDQSSEPGSTIRSLWIVDHSEPNQAQARRAGQFLEEAGILSAEVFGSDEEPHADRIARLQRELFSSPDWVFYYGHGARHIWQTGAHDYVEQSSLFTSEKLEQWPLRENTRPVRIVFSATCDSAPFDHPEDDSLGERFVTMPGGGSLAFVGASWRIQGQAAIQSVFARAALDSATAGEALLRSKQNMRDRALRAGFNLLGDPAAPIRR